MQRHARSSSGTVICVYSKSQHPGRVSALDDDRLKATLKDEIDRFA